MEYDMEELLPIVQWLVEKYTSKESSSVTHETAQMLMGAVIYCVNENYQGNYLVGTRKLNARTAYERGLELVIEKTHQAKTVYEQLILDFEDYGCENYRDTIIKGIPAFFVNYDFKFNPQDHLLTLDYPSLVDRRDLCGVDLILEYLQGIQQEQWFLGHFPRTAVVALLESAVPDYVELYLDNICNLVLFHAIGCAIADQPVSELRLNEESWQEIKLYFKDDDVAAIEAKITRLIGMLIKRMSGEPEYFTRAARGYAHRIAILQ